MAADEFELLLTSKSPGAEYGPQVIPSKEAATCQYQCPTANAAGIVYEFVNMPVADVAPVNETLFAYCTLYCNPGAYTFVYQYKVGGL